MLRGINKQRIFHEPVDYQCLCEDKAMYERLIQLHQVRNAGAFIVDGPGATIGFPDSAVVILVGFVQVRDPGAANVEDFQKLPETKQSNVITRMRKSGAPLRQISRLSGISLARVRKMLVS